MAKIRLHPRTSVVPQIFSAADTNVGIPYVYPWSEPKFEKAYPARLQQTQMHVQQPGLTAGIDGIAWQKDWETPRFLFGVRADLQQTQMYVPVPPANLSKIQGTAYLRIWDQPEQVRVKVEKQQSIMYTAVPPEKIASIQGIGWQVTWNTPYFPKKYKVELQQTNFFVVSPATLPIGIRGMAWYRGYDQPKQKRVEAQFQQTALWTSRSAPAVFARGYIIGPA